MSNNRCLFYYLFFYIALVLRCKNTKVGEKEHLVEMELLTLYIVIIDYSCVGFRIFKAVMITINVPILLTHVLFIIC